MFVQWIQIKAPELYFSEVMFMMLYKVLFQFKSTDVKS